MLTSTTKHPHGVRSLLPKNYRLAYVSVISIAIALLSLKHVSLLSIDIYQKYISPFNNHYCPYASVHTDESSCSVFAEAVIAEKGALVGVYFLYQRFKDCKIASGSLFPPSCNRSILGEASQNTATCISECNKCYNQCTASCEEGLQLLWHQIKEEAKERLRQIRKKIANAWRQFFSSIEKKIDALLNDSKPEDTKSGKGGREQKIKPEIRQVKAIVETSQMFDGRDPEFGDIIDTIQDLKEKNIISEVENETGINYINELPTGYRIVMAALENVGQTSGLTSYGFDPAFRNEMFKKAINDYVQNKDQKKTEIKVAVFARLSLFNNRNKQIIFDRITTINPQKQVGSGIAAQRMLGVRRQCKEWVDWIANGNGGKSIPYKKATITLTQSLASAGKAVYLKSPQHAAIIVKLNRVNSETNGLVIESIQIAEANWSDEWEYPVGQIPWDRRISLRSIKKKEFKDWKVADIDAAKSQK